LVDLVLLSPRERLAAEQAVLTVRALDKAADQAPHGQGMSCLEKVITQEGFRHLREMLANAVSARAEAQKKGSAFEAVRVAAKRSSRRPKHAVS